MANDYLKDDEIAAEDVQHTIDQAVSGRDRDEVSSFNSVTALMNDNE
ncbi:hypothetical protein [Secundilactobacillus paracollinoides]|nr:hypothetical protein [Secundilactobacillus paracollinoides]